MQIDENLLEKEMNEVEDYIEEEENLEKESEAVDFSKEEEEETVDFSDLSSIKASDTVKNYLKEIGNIPLLTTEQEYEYSIRVKKGNDAKRRLLEIETDDQNNIAIEEYEELLNLKDDGMIARDKIASANLRLVVAIAKRYLNRGLEFMDLIQEGNMGLLKAIDKFEPDKGFKFSTYATWWIRQSITRAVADQARTIRIPVHMVETINKIRRIERQLTSDLGRAPTDEEVSNAVGISINNLNRIRQIATSPVSLESPVGEEEDSTLGDFISDDSQLTPYEYTLQNKMKADIHECLNEILSDREKLVIIRRFGLDGQEAMTLEEVAKTFTPHVTRERIRQIECKALRRLMRHPKAKRLKEYLAN